MAVLLKPAFTAPPAPQDSQVTTPWVHDQASMQKLHRYTRNSASLRRATLAGIGWSGHSMRGGVLEEYGDALRLRHTSQFCKSGTRGQDRRVEVEQGGGAGVEEREKVRYEVRMEALDSCYGSRRGWSGMGGVGRWLLG